MLRLRLDEPLLLAAFDGALDGNGIARLAALGLAERGTTSEGAESLALTRPGRFLGNAVTAELLA